MTINNLTHKKKTFYFAHRGAPRLKAENTIESFATAIELGCDGIEMDIQCTQDNQIIIFHDDYILHNQRKHYIAQLPYDNIKKLCHDINIIIPPLLEEALPIISRYSDIIFNFEIKSKSLNNYFIIQELKRTLNYNQIIQQCIISSFNYTLLLQLKTFFPQVAIGFILGSKRLKYKKNLFLYKLMIKFLKPTYIHPNAQFINLLFSKWLLENQFIINAYTINDQTMLDNMLELGVTGIFTDNHKFYSNN